MKACFFIGWLSAALLGCGFSGETVDRVGQGTGSQIPPRYASVVSDGCTPDAWQSSALASAGMRRFVKEVVLLCAVPRANGDVGPADPSARHALARVADQLRSEGYKVGLGVSFTDETAERYDGAQTAQLLADPVWRSRVVASLVELSKAVDGLELDLQKLPPGARADVSRFVEELSLRVRPSKELALLVPPSTRDPSDVDGGAAFDLPALAQWVGRMRVMTLDYSDPTAGPTIDPGWAVDAVRFARSKVGELALDVAVPLYGNDVSDLGTRSVSYLEARAIAESHRLPIELGPTGAPHFFYLDTSGRGHELWYDDADSTARTLRAWEPSVLPLDVGVVFYGLGAEDPALWSTLERALP